MKYYAGIGSRETPPEICEFMRWVAYQLAEKKWILRSGGAEGADSAFESGVIDYWAEDSPMHKQIFKTCHVQPWTEVFVDHFHPAPERLKPFPRKLMQRNAMQILGKNGDTPVQFVMCWTKDGKASGGTGQALRIADYYNIPIYNFYYEETRQKIERKLNG